MALAQDSDTAAPGVLLDRIVAVVNEGVVLHSDLDRQVKAFTAQLQERNVELPPPDVFEKQILERLIVEELQFQRAENLGLKVTDEVVNSAVSAIAQRNNVEFEQLPAILASQGVDYLAFREGIRRELILEQLRNRDLLGRINVTKEEAEQYILNQDADDSSEYEISQILLTVPSDASLEEVARVEKEIQAVHARLEEGAEFANMAVSYSSGQQALQGGKIGWRKKQELPTMFAKIVAALAPGEFSKPIRSNSGFHLVRLDQKRGDTRKPIIVTEYHARHILVAPSEIRTDAAAQAKAMTLRGRLLAGEDFAELARNNSDDHSNSGAGGDLGWAGPHTYVEEFGRALTQLSPGELSEPVRTAFGWHLIELLEVRQEDKTAESRLNEAANQIRARKAQDEAESWLLRMRDEAFVDYRL